MGWIDDEILSKNGATIAKTAVKQYHFLHRAPNTQPKEFVDIVAVDDALNTAVGLNGDLFNEAIYI